MLASATLEILKLEALECDIGHGVRFVNALYNSVELDLDDRVSDVGQLSSDRT